ncbi:Gamma-tubulin complex component 5, partial [Rhizopus stolonifer]
EFLQPSRPIGFHETNQFILKYDMLRLLLSLSSSLNQDYNYKPKLQRILQKKPLTWKEVVDNDPLEGDHWNQWPEDTSSDGNLSDYDEDQTQTQHQKKDTGMLDIEPLNYTNRMDMDTRSDQDGLRYLEKQQYWRDDFNLPKETLVEDTLLQNACQMSDTLMKLWQHQTGQDQKKTITEAGVIREVLSLLRGFGGILFVKEDDQFLLNEQYMVQHLSQHALSSILNEFNVYGNMLLKLRQQLMHSSPKDGQTMEAFVSVVHQLLAEFDGFLATLESNTSFITQDNTLVISLLQLRKQLSESLESLKAVYRIAADMPFEKTPKCIAIFLISILYERTMISHITGQESIYHTLLYVLQKTLVPYGHMMDDWVFFGSLMADRAREFYVTRNDAVSKHDSNFWLNGFVMESVAHEKCYPCPLFDERVMARVLFAGKAMNLLSHNQKSKGVHFEQVMHQFIPTKSFFIQPVSTQRQSEPVSSLVAAFFPLVTFNTPSREPDTIDNMNLLFDQSFLSCLETYIDIPYTEAAKALDVLLYEKCQLLDQMVSLFSIYFMLENDLMHSFCEALFRQMDQKEFWLNPRLLNQTFANACETSGYDEIVYIGIRESAEGLVTQASSLELLEFKVEIPWPLDNFIQKNLIPSYSKILGFLLRLKRAKYVMEKKT